MVGNRKITSGKLLERKLGIRNKKRANLHLFIIKRKIYYSWEVCVNRIFMKDTIAVDELSSFKTSHAIRFGRVSFKPRILKFLHHLEI